MKNGKWIIVLVAYDDPRLEARVLKEQIPASENEELHAFLRGGELVTVLREDEEAVAEMYRQEIEKQRLR